MLDWTDNMPEDLSISKRFYAACMIAQGYIAADVFPLNYKEDLVKHSYKIANEMIKQEES